MGVVGNLGFGFSLSLQVLDFLSLSQCLGESVGFWGIFIEQGVESVGNGIVGWNILFCGDRFGVYSQTPIFMFINSNQRL